MKSPFFEVLKIGEHEKLMIHYEQSFNPYLDRYN